MGFGPRCLVLDLWRNVSFSDHQNHPATFTEIGIPPQVFLCFTISQMVAKCKTQHIHVFLNFQETLLLDFLEMNFSKIVIFTILKCHFWDTGLIVELWIKNLLTNYIA